MVGVRLARCAVVLADGQLSDGYAAVFECSQDSARGADGGAG